MARSRLSKRYRKHRRNPSDSSGPRANPPLMTDLAEWIGPAFAGFAATRLLTRIVGQTIAKKAPKFGKHSAAAASVTAFLASWFLANRVKLLAKYHMPLVVGAGIAAAQSLIQLYIPKLGWVVSDASPEIANARPAQLPADVEELDDEDPNLYTYADQYDPGRMDRQQTRADQRAPAAASNPPEDDLSDLDLVEEVGQTQNMGIFGGAN